MISRLFCSAAALALLSGVASAGLIFETEPNSTLETANDIGPFNAPGTSLAIDGFITPGVPRGNPAGEPGDVDWFTFTITDFAFIGVTAFAFELFNHAAGGFVEADSALELVDSQGNVLLYSDDDGPGLNPSFGTFLIPGTYFIGIAPYEDLNFPDSARGKGPGPEILPDLFNGYDEFNDRPTQADFAYKLIIGVNVAPAPGAATTLALAGLVAVRRRR